MSKIVIINDFASLIAWMPVSLRTNYENILASLRRKQLKGSFPCARTTLEIMRSVLGTCKFSSTEQMMNAVRQVGAGLLRAAPYELTIGNITRRVLFILREEYANKQKVECAPKEVAGPRIETQETPSADSLSSPSKRQDALPDQPSLSRLLSTEAAATVHDFSRSWPDFRANVMAAINELSEEMENVNQPIADVSVEHIHADECIFTFGSSVTIELFLLSAAKKRRFNVIIAEHEPLMSGHKMAETLSKHPNIGVTLIPDSNIYGIMSRVNKVIFSPQAVTADGGAICLAGQHMIAIAAKENAIPVIGVTGAYKLTPQYCHNQEHVLNHMLSPSASIPYNTPVNNDNVEVFCAAYDFVPPDLIDLFVTNNGSHQPSYIYRLLCEYFHPSDHVIS